MSAVFSDCGKYRYRLDRIIGEGPPVVFLLHNPSTAGASTEDRTSIRGIGFARSLGFGRLTFINVWAKIATRPHDLWIDDDPVGSFNDEHITHAVREVAREHGRLIGAWGRIHPPALKRSHAEERIKSVVEIARAEANEIFALKVNSDGSPKHPLYVPRDAKPSVWTHVARPRLKSVETNV